VSELASSPFNTAASANAGDERSEEHRVSELASSPFNTAASANAGDERSEERA
jgi:hypothetical protein